MVVWGSDWNVKARQSRYGTARCGALRIGADRCGLTGQLWQVEERYDA